jgi:hypothetical protein
MHQLPVWSLLRKLLRWLSHCKQQQQTLQQQQGPRQWGTLSVLAAATACVKVLDTAHHAYALGSGNGYHQVLCFVLKT